MTRMMEKRDVGLFIKVRKVEMLFLVTKLHFGVWKTVRILTSTKLFYTLSTYRPCCAHTGKVCVLLSPYNANNDHAYTLIYKSSL